jgi:uncharacterized protein YbjT (DUF2867 family)
LPSPHVENVSELQRHAIAAAREAGVTHVVKLSAFGASPCSDSLIGRFHYQIENDLQESGVAWTMLRPHHFMQNLLSQTENIVNIGGLLTGISALSGQPQSQGYRLVPSYWMGLA